MIRDGGCQQTAAAAVDDNGDDDGDGRVGQSGVVMMKMMRRGRGRWGLEEDHLRCRRGSLSVVVVLVYTVAGTARRRSP